MNSKPSGETRELLNRVEREVKTATVVPAPPQAADSKQLEKPAEPVQDIKQDVKETNA